MRSQFRAAYFAYTNRLGWSLWYLRELQISLYTSSFAEAVCRALRISIHFTYIAYDTTSYSEWGSTWHIIYTREKKSSFNQFPIIRWLLIKFKCKCAGGEGVEDDRVENFQLQNECLHACGYRSVLGSGREEFVWVFSVQGKYNFHICIYGIPYPHSPSLSSRKHFQKFKVNTRWQLHSNEQVYFYRLYVVLN